MMLRRPPQAAHVGVVRIACLRLQCGVPKVELKHGRLSLTTAVLSEHRNEDADT